MRVVRMLLLLLLPLAVALPARAATDSADAPHVHVQLVTDEYAVYAPDEVLAGLYFKLEPGWHVYWKNPGDAGEAPKLAWTLPNGVHAEPISFPAPKRLPLGPLMDFGYEDEVLFPMKITVDSSFKPGSTVHLAAKVSWLVCRDSCIPEKADLALDIPVVHGKQGGNGISIALLKRFQGQLPQPLPAGSKLGFTATPAGFRLTVETGRRETQAVFFPEEQYIIDNPSPQKLTATAKGFVLDLKKDSELKAAPAELRGVLELAGGRAYEIVARPGLAAVAAGPMDQGKSAGSQAQPSLNAPNAASETPAFQAAVAPPVSTDGAGPWAALLRATGLAFLGGLLLNLMPCVFPVLFLKGLALAQSGQQIQSGGNTEKKKLRLHGLVYAAGILSSFWLLVGVLLGLRAAGSTLGWGFQFQSPVFLSLMAGLLFFLGLSLAGQFEIGLTLTSKGGSLAQKQGLPGSFFTGVLAVIVATPCTAPFMGAAVGYALSQSALITFAVFTALALGLAAPYLALTLQPAWTRLLPRPGAWMEILKQATAVPIFATVIWLAWVLAQAYGASLLAALLVGFLLLAIAGWFLGRWPARRVSRMAACVFIALMIALAFYAQRWVQAPSIESTEGAAARSAWSVEAVRKAQAEGRPVFVDFTASWCLSCQVNERVALNQPEVQAAFQAKNVLFLKADWTRHDEAITQALMALGRSGVPTYALYLPGENSPRLLPEALTQGIVLEALQ
jgi:thiol:disulfide interchange protein DsbD